MISERGMPGGRAPLIRGRKGKTASAPANESKIARGPVTLLTDFGLEDAYAGVMKGVILSINPRANIIDMTHGVRPGDIPGAQFILRNSVKYFPKGSVHVVVVDPGVGSGRRAIIVRAGGVHFTGPDNGVLTGFFPGAEKIVSITEERFTLESRRRSSSRRQLSSKRRASSASFGAAASFGLQGATFDGRDVFAPVAAWLSRGVRAEDFGPGIKDPVELPLPEPVCKEGGISGRVLHVDRFGNCITNIDPDHLLKLGRDRNRIRVRVKGKTFGLVDFYLSHRDRDPHALVNSDGLLEIFMPGGDASRALGLKAGAPVTVF